MPPRHHTNDVEAIIYYRTWKFVRTVTDLTGREDMPVRAFGSGVTAPLEVDAYPPAHPSNSAPFEAREI